MARDAVWIAAGQGIQRFEKDYQREPRVNRGWRDLMGELCRG
jgi:hypothetical protein